MLSVNHLITNTNWAGVERIRDEFQNYFDASSMIFSSDNLLKEKNLEEMDKIKSGKLISLLVLNWSLGYNFPHLKLVAVIDADMGLNAGDHRVIEKSYRVIKQVVGRAGRYTSDGKTLIKLGCLNICFTGITAGSWEKFLNTELEQRIEATAPWKIYFVDNFRKKRTSTD